jgi:hypothetical protein
MKMQDFHASLHRIKNDISNLHRNKGMMAKKDKNNTTELSVFSINYWVLGKVLMAQTNRAA